MKYIKILHLIPSLGSGGAEAMLTKLIVNNKNSEAKMTVVTLLDNDYFYNEISKTGTKIYSLQINKGKLGLLNLLKLYKVIRNENPDIIQTWMYHCDLLGVLLKFLFPSKKLVWNIRHSKLVEGVDKATTIMIANILSKLSFIPNNIICGSTAAYHYHSKLGYRKKKMVVIPNGFDINYFSPNDSTNYQVREELGIDLTETLIGHVGRAKDIKNQIALLKVFSNLSKKYSNISLILIGSGIREKYIDNNLVINNDNIILLDETQQVERYLKSLDLFVLPSLSEGFPNVLGEAMSSGVPCIANDVGDSSLIIGKKEMISQVNSLSELEEIIENWIKLTKEQKSELKKYSRDRIINLFSIQKIVFSYINLYKKQL